MNVLTPQMFSTVHSALRNITDADPSVVMIATNERMVFGVIEQRRLYVPFTMPIGTFDAVLWHNDFANNDRSAMRFAVAIARDIEMGDRRNPHT